MPYIPDAGRRGSYKVKSKPSKKLTSESRSLEDYLYELEKAAIEAEYSDGGGGGGGSRGGGGGGGQAGVNALRSFKEKGSQTIGTAYDAVKAAMQAQAANVKTVYDTGVANVGQNYQSGIQNIQNLQAPATQQVAAQAGLTPGSGQLQAQINAEIQGEIAKDLARQQATKTASVANLQTLGTGIFGAAQQFATSADVDKERALGKFTSQLDLDIAKAVAASIPRGGGGGGGRSGGSSKEGKKLAKQLRAEAKYLKSKEAAAGKTKKEKEKPLKASGKKGLMALAEAANRPEIGQSLIDIMEDFKDKDEREAAILDYIQEAVYGPEITKTRQVPRKKNWYEKATDFTFEKVGLTKAPFGKAGNFTTEEYFERANVPKFSRQRAQAAQQERDLQAFIDDLMRQYRGY